MALLFILLIFFSGACASTKQPDVDVDILKILTDLQTQVTSQKQLISTLQAEVTSHKTRISILEDLLGKEERFNPDDSDPHPKQNQSASKVYDTEVNVPDDKQDDHNQDKTNKFTKGRVLASRLVVNAEGPVAFQAYLNNDITHIAIHQKIMFDHVVLNLGNSYHNNHGLFIAPRPGIYIFSGSLLAHHSKGIEMQFMKNGVSLGGGVLANTVDNVHGGYDQGSATVVTQLDIGDEVWIENQYPDDTSLRASPYTCFMGCLITEI